MNNVENRPVTANSSNVEAHNLTQNRPVISENQQNLSLNRMVRRSAESSPGSARNLAERRDDSELIKTTDASVDFEVLQKLHVPDSSKFYDPTDMELSIKLLDNHIDGLEFNDAEEKFKYVCAVLPREACKVVSDYIINPPEYFQYEILKIALCERTFLNEVKNPDHQYTEDQIAIHKPSAILGRMRAQIKLPDSNIRNYFYEFLPRDLHEMVVGPQETNLIDLENAASFGDALYGMERSFPPSTQLPERQAPSRTSGGALISMKGEIEGLGKMLCRKLSELDDLRRKEIQVLSFRDTLEESMGESRRTDIYRTVQEIVQDRRNEREGSRSEGQAAEPNQNTSQRNTVRNRQDRSVQSSPPQS